MLTETIEDREMNKLAKLAPNKTHYRKAFNSPYLSAADITEPTRLTIERAVLEGDKSKKSKDQFNTVYFQEACIREGEPLKPMILNATNSRMLRQITGSHYLEDWSGTAVTIYVDSNVRFGRDTVEGLRLMPAQSRTQVTPDNAKLWAGAINAYKRDGNFDAVLERADISKVNQMKIMKEVRGDA